MQISSSLADFMSHLDDGPRGVEDALGFVTECKRKESSTLDLQQMSLTDEDMVQLVPHFKQLSSHVTTLNLFMNDINVLPAEISQLQNLKTLHVGCNPLQTIHPSALETLHKLEELDIGFSDSLSVLPDTFAQLKSLRVLLAGNGRLGQLPDSLFECNALEELHVYGNCLKEIPHGVGRLTNLKVLNAGRNQITTVADDIGKCTKLHTLRLYENCLSSLPSDIVSLAMLKILSVESNANLPNLPRETRSSANVKAAATFYATGATN